ncbi:serine--tRNA ligase [Mycoplasmopsis pullorum]|uniref:Serine--tRNA ligase n=1 Tax=Mycoplasmopsis pullorum TaxID=48003 RepID=A0A1L4FRY4_9BACT|nr:serine--tRNA ligase [Mycoplasmopsis pullorum]APJ38349.1 serine--tRNA ligase [Mycoplasmopsis pullorum]
MLNIKYILENEQKIRTDLVNRGFDISIYDRLVELGKVRGNLMFEAQQKKAELSKFSKQFAVLKNQPEELKKVKNEIAIIKKEQIELEEKAKSLNDELDQLLLAIPNEPLDGTPVGKDENFNKVLNVKDKIGRGLVAGVKPHYVVGEKLGLFDIETATKLSGARFVLYKNRGAKLVRALMNFMLDLHETKGYQEILPPVLVRDQMLYGTGQLPKFKDDLFTIKDWNLYLIPTAEVPLTNIYNNEIVDLSTPACFTAFTECFRSEAGSSGKDTKGILRQHQFKKVELVKITTKEDALAEYEKMLEDAKDVLEKLEIPYRELLLCTGDLGFSARKTIDLELWLPSEIKFREVSSVSYVGDFQARRAMIRYKDANGETQYAHTMNGSGLAIDRIVAAILENYQNPDGSVSVPKVLVPYMNGLEIIE